MPSRNQKKRSKQRVEYLQKQDKILQDSVKPERAPRPISKRRSSVRDSYKADPEKKKASVRDSYNADIESKQSAKRQRYQEDVEENRAYAEMSGQKSEVINSRFANQRIFPYIYP